MVVRGLPASSIAGCRLWFWLGAGSASLREVDAEVINRALQTTPPEGRTHWSAKTPAAATGISTPTKHPWLQTFSVQPHP